MGFYNNPIDNRYARQNLHMNTSSQKQLISDYEKGSSGGPMSRGKRFMNPSFPMDNFEPFIGSPSKRFSNPGATINNSMVQPLGDQASYSPENRVYDDFIINDLINQGTILPSEVYDMGEDGYKQIRPRLMGQELQGPLAYG